MRPSNGFLLEGILDRLLERHGTSPGPCGPKGAFIQGFSRDFQVWISTCGNGEWQRRADAFKECLCRPHKCAARTNLASAASATARLSKHHAIPRRSANS